MRALRPVSLRCQSGRTLTELMLVAAILPVVLGGTLAVLETAAKVAPEEQERMQAVRETQVGLDRIVRELRQTTQVTSYAPGRIEVVTSVAANPTAVAYDCLQPSRIGGPYTACVRESGGRSDVVIDRVLNGEQVFTRSDDFVAVKVEVPASGERERPERDDEGYEHHVVLEDGFFMRNLSYDD